MVKKGSLFQSTVPNEIFEGIRDTIGRKNVTTLKKMIRLEKPQGDKSDAKVLILTPYRCQILGIKAPFKMEADFHFLDIKSMDSPSPERLIISTNQGKIYFMLMIGTDDADHIIGRVALSLRTIFPNVALSRILKASLDPVSRQKVIQTMLNQADEAEPGPCGNFSEMYRCVCDYLNSPVREDVEWDVDTIYLSQNCREINLKDFDLPETKDIIPIISVMIYNRWFEGLVVRNTKLNGEVLEFILKVTRNSHNLKELSLEGIGIKGDFAQRLANNLIENKESQITVLDISNNPLEDKGLLHLSGALPVVKHGSIEKLNVSRTGLTAKGINGLCQSLRSSPNIMNSLTHLNLSGNCIRSDDAEGLYNFLSSENHITDLDISATDCSVEVFVSALAKGCTKHLQNVSLARNHFYGKNGTGLRYPHYLEEDYAIMRKSKDSTLPASFQEFFRDTVALKLIDFSCMKFPADALKCILDGLLGNKTSGLAVSLNLATCELKSAGCQVLQSTIASLTNLEMLDVTDNSFDSDISTLLVWIQQNKSLKELKIGRNFFGIKPKHMRLVMEGIVELVQEEDSCLESLSLADSKIREYIHTLLGCLGSNTSLTSLDISGNFMGDGGSRVLAKSLQINSKLRILKLDRNNFTAIGFHEIANALEKNYTLRYMPYPVNDAVAAMKHHPERTQNALARIQDLLLRNANANRGSNDQQFRLQKVVTNTAQQVLDKVAEKVDDTVNALEILDADSASSKVVMDAKNLVKDAKNSKQLLSDIYGLGMEKTSGSDSQLQRKLDEMATNIDDMVKEHLKETVETMTKNAEAQCPHMFEEIKDELQTSVDQRCQLPPESVKDHVIKSSGTEIVNKVSELNLAIATLISDKVTDTLLAALSQCNISLTEQLNKHKNQPKVDPTPTASTSTQTPQKDAKNADVKANGVALRPSAITVTDERGVQRPEGGDLLPNMRKERAASVAKRRQRPVTSPAYHDDSGRKSPRVGELRTVKSVCEDEEKKITDFGVDEEDMKTDEDVADDNEKPNKEIPPIVVDEVDGAPELPEAPEQKLEHVTKARPRGPTRRPRRPPSKRASAVKEQNVDTFFDNNVSNTDFTATPTVEEEEEIKRKERLEEKKIGKKVPGGMGMPLLTPDMLKSKNKQQEEEKKEDEEEEKEEKPAEESKTGDIGDDRSPSRRPKGAMVMPGMGFGGNLLAEMKLKKLAKKSESEEVKSPDSTKKPEPFKKPDGNKSGPTSPFPALKKTSPKHENPNENNNNSSIGTSPSKSSFLSRLKSSKTDKANEKKDSEKESPAKVKPLMPPTKPVIGKGKPPPLPSKPKPPLLKPGHESKSRPMSEFLEPHAASSLVRTRAASWGKHKSDKDGN